MDRYRFIALPTDVAARLRAIEPHPHGLTRRRQRVSEDDAAPCRHCLEDAKRGEEVVLASFSPFAGDGPYNERGPIFVHAHGCAPHVPSAVIPSIVAKRLVVVRAYNAREEIIAADVVEGRESRALAEQFLAHDDAAFLHVRAARHGCYLCRIERTG